ncbi:MAG: alpha/beta hydrolase [Ignavibacteriaceae bacterium]|nr:alpha/beta hydrolase [Ignavibacteriaceae bacterium]
MNAVNKIILSFCCVNFFSVFYYAQSEADEVKVYKDTSFTIQSAFNKEKIKYPFIKIAKTLLSPNILYDSNVVYKEYGKRKLRLDMFFPKENWQKYPAVILVHGGGWLSGDKSQQIPMAQELAAFGFVTAAVEYRLSPEAKYPAAILDLKSSIRWLRANSSKYNIDTNKIAALGCSSGGHLVSMLGVTNGNPKFELGESYIEHSSDVQAVVDIDGVLDFTHPAESGKDNDPKKPSVGKLWLGYTFNEKPDIWKEASPISYVDENTPPFLFINSSNDRFHAGRDKLIEKLNKHCTYSEVHTFANSPHPFWFFHPWFFPTINTITHFLNRVFHSSNTKLQD